MIIKLQKTTLLLFFFLLTSLDVFCQETTQRIVVRSGITLGSVLAVVLSWERNKSILLAFLHGVFGFLYVIYFALTRKPNERK